MILMEVLPPIGGLKGKRDSKMKTTFKTAANVLHLDHLGSGLKQPRGL
jgi:hypothetical protein